MNTEATGLEAVERISRGDYWEINDKAAEELVSPVPEALRESAGEMRGPESLEALKKFLREERSFHFPGDEEPPEDNWPSGGGGTPPPPERPHDPIGGGGAVLPQSELVDIN